MMRVLLVETERFPIAGSFTISRGSKTEADVLCCTLHQNAQFGRGECVPYRRYGETMESVAAQIESVREAVCAGADRHALLGLMPAGAARNALDCALWDLEAKLTGVPVQTTFVVSLYRAHQSAMNRLPATTPLAPSSIGMIRSRNASSTKSASSISST